MNKHLQELIQVANFDKQIDDLVPKIALVRQELDHNIMEESKTLKLIEKLKEECNSIELEIANHDRNIQEANAKLESIAKKQKEVKSEKEFRALDVETDIAKENLTNSNNEIERLEALKNAKEEEQASFKPKLETLKNAILTLQEQTKGKVDEIKQVQQELFDKKQSLVEQMDNKITSFYAKIRRWAGNTSVVPVFKQACGGCFIRLSDTAYSEILKGQDIISCPHCGRILYNSESAPKSQDTGKTATKKATKSPTKAKSPSKDKKS